jgi:hypothetical protein
MMRLTLVCFVLVLALMPAATLAMPSCSVTFSMDDLCFSEYVHGSDTFDVVGLRGIGH